MKVPMKVPRHDAERGLSHHARSCQGAGSYRAVEGFWQMNKQVT
jgi:hypothetical protein